MFCVEISSYDYIIRIVLMLLCSVVLIVEAGGI